MSDRNPLLVSEARKSWFKRVLGHGGGDSLDPAELQRMEAELVKQARIAELRQKHPRGGLKTHLEAFLPVKEGEPGSRPKFTGTALRRALRRAERRHYGRHHGRQHRIPR